jgi:hypothetical protein
MTKKTDKAAKAQEEATKAMEVEMEALQNDPILMEMAQLQQINTHYSQNLLGLILTMRRDIEELKKTKADKDGI